MIISIITVCFNSCKTIEDTIKSVATQSYTDIEHIIIDGASTDGTLDVIDRYRSRISKVVSEPDHGIYDAMNKGIALASGDIIGFLNADDIYSNNGVLAKVVGVISAEKIDAVFGDAEFFSSENPDRTIRRYSSARFRPNRIAWGWMPAHPTLFVARDVFKKYGVFRTHFRIAGDFDFVARVFQDGRIKYLHLPEVLVRMRTGGISTGGWRNTVLLNREVLRACRENGIRTNIFKILSKYPVKLLEFLRK